MKPILYSPGIIDPSKVDVIPFRFNWNGEVPIGIKLKIEEYDKTVGTVSYYRVAYEDYMEVSDGSSFNVPKTIIPFIADSGNAYLFYVKIRYKNPIDDSTMETDYSAPVNVYFYSTPGFVFADNVTDGKILKKSSNTFGIEYVPMSEELSLSNFKIGLYDVSKNLISESESLYLGGTYSVDGMMNNTSYYVKADGIAKSGIYTLDISTGFVRVNVRYDSTTLNIPIIAENKNGVIKVAFDGTNLSLESFSSVKLRRKEVGTSNWLTIMESEKSLGNDEIVFNDISCEYGKEYQYIAIPVFKDGTEGGYEPENLSLPIKCIFDGVIIANNSEVWGGFANLSYGRARSNKVNAIETIGGRFPVIIKNNAISYHSGSVSAFFCEFNCATNKFDISNGTAYRDKLYNFLTDGTAKIYKTSRGLCYIVGITSGIDESDTSKDTPTTSFSWMQIGDVNSYDDLLTNGLIGD